jgi:hypothetical protein
MQASLHSTTMVIECKNIGAQVSKPTLMTYYEYLNAPQHVMNRSLSCQSRLPKTLSKPLYSYGDHWILTKNPSGSAALKDYLFLSLAQANPLFSFTKK